MAIDFYVLLLVSDVILQMNTFWINMLVKMSNIGKKMSKKITVVMFLVL